MSTETLLTVFALAIGLGALSSAAMSLYNVYKRKHDEKSGD